MYRDYVDRKFTWRNFNLEEQAKVIVAPTSNNELKTTKLKTEFPELLSIKDSLIKFTTLEHGTKFIENLDEKKCCDEDMLVERMMINDLICATWDKYMKDSKVDVVASTKDVITGDDESSSPTKKKKRVTREQPIDLFQQNREQLTIC
ncbi:hypothetical protein OSB04_023693 [Centaurea solstitialis]|uniref:Uncharacterized protein n=1 Tax=Centaurea solstitialis TaxID=347529 RepID=A0AA38SWH0_9ASTR|nr:hypothetical protein OSB04_023693 [Centaurea solstitialis]